MLSGGGDATDLRRHVLHGIFPEGLRLGVYKQSPFLLFSRSLSDVPHYHRHCDSELKRSLVSVSDSDPTRSEDAIPAWHYRLRL